MATEQLKSSIDNRKNYYTVHHPKWKSIPWLPVKYLKSKFANSLVASFTLSRLTDILCWLPTSDKKVDNMTKHISYPISQISDMASHRLARLSIKDWQSKNACPRPFIFSWWRSHYHLKIWYVYKKVCQLLEVRPCTEGDVQISIIFILDMNFYVVSSIILNCEIEKYQT